MLACWAKGLRNALICMETKVKRRAEGNTSIHTQATDPFWAALCHLCFVRCYRQCVCLCVGVCVLCV